MGWENHKRWQGRVYSIRAGDKYPNIYEKCGLGYVDGLEGANCRHRRFPFIDGISERAYTDEQLANIDPPPFEYEGRTYTAYQATQKQRQIERTIRKQKRLKNAYTDAGLEEDAQAANIRLRRLNAKYKEFSKAAGLPEQRERLRVYNPVESAKIVENTTEHGIIKALDIDDFKLLADGKNIDPDAIDVIFSTVKDYEQSGQIYINDAYFGSLKSSGNGTPLLQIEPYGRRMIRLNVNTDIFGGRTLNEIDRMIQSTDANLAQSLREAVVHECGHAKSIKGMTITEIEAFYSEIANAKITGISNIANKDGAEALAEIEVLLVRGEVVPDEAMEFYNKYMGSGRR